MKNILSVLLLTFFSVSNAQTVSDYKYITVPRKFEDFEKNNFKLDAHLKMYLRKKNYEIIVEGVTEKPSDLKQNPCLAAKANIENIKSTFKNKLKVVFTDCNDKILKEYDGVSSIKEFDKGYQEALSFAMNNVPMQNAKEVATVATQQENKPAITSTNEPMVVSINENTVYTLEGKKYEAVKLSKGSFLLMDTATAQNIAQFYPSSQKNVYHVMVISPQGNYQTIGFIYGNELIIEYQNADRSWTTTTYVK